MNTLASAPTTGARPRYTAAEKLEIVRFARNNSTRAACERFNVARSSIYLWTARESALLASFRALHHPNHREEDALEIATPTVVSSTAQISPQASTRSSGESRTPHHVHLGGYEDNQADSDQCQTPDTFAGEDYERASLTTGAPVRSEATFMPMHGREDAIGPVLVGYQGACHGFPCAAAQLAFSRALPAKTPAASAFELTSFSQASHVLDALHKGEIDFAFLSTEALLSNTYHAALNQMVASRLKIISEVVVQEDAEVCALPGTELCDADCVVSDWRTLQRYEEYIVQLELQFKRTIYRQVEWDSAAGCALVQREKAHKTLVLCTPSAAAANRLTVLQGGLIGAPPRSRYTILRRQETTPLTFEPIDRAPTATPAATFSTLLVKGTARAILDIISAFTFRGLEIVSFHARGDEEQLYPLVSVLDRRSYVISYRASTNHLVEKGLQLQLEATAERVVTLGDFATHVLRPVT